MVDFWQKSRTIYPSVFRFLVGIVFLLDLIFTLSNSFVFNTDFADYPNMGSTIEFLRENYISFYLIYGLVLVLFILGIGKKIVSAAVFIFHFLSIMIVPSLTNWGDTIMKFTLLYFIFVDSFKYLSVNPTHSDSRNLKLYISKLAVWSIILNLFLVYLSNSVYKLFDVDWQNGYATFFSFSQFLGVKSSFFYPIISNEFLSKAISYIIVAQQMTFLPLIIWKRTRYFAILLGVLIHLIMFFQFGLWKFETIMILLYGFLLNDEEWKNLIPKNLKNKLFQSS